MVVPSVKQETTLTHAQTRWVVSPCIHHPARPRRRTTQVSPRPGEAQHDHAYDGLLHARGPAPRRGGRGAARPWREAGASPWPATTPTGAWTRHSRPPAWLVPGEAGAGAVSEAGCELSDDPESRHRGADARCLWNGHTLAGRPGFRVGSRVFLPNSQRMVRLLRC